MLVRRGCEVSEARRQLAQLARSSVGAHMRGLLAISFSPMTAGTATCAGSVFRKREVDLVLRAVLPHVTALRWEVTCLTDLHGPRCRYAQVADGTAIFRGPVIGSERVAVLASGDPAVRVLTDHDDMLLVSTADGTVGWIAEERCRVIDEPASAVPRQYEASTFLAHAEAYLGCRYLLGGSTSEGLDCSGLIWRAALDAGTPQMPRHSNDQLRALAPVSRGRVSPGDLVFIRREALSPLHAGIVGRRRTVIHASSSRRCVIREEVDDFLARASWVAVMSHRSADAMSA
jgi:cell wall-associated NlpC family hydrolase